MSWKVWTIGWNAFRETVRQPVFCVVLAIAGGLIALSPVFSMFTLLESERLVKDMGLSTILVAGLLLAVLSASNVVSEEVRGRTALMVVSRPVGRWAFVAGKFLGLALAQLVAVYLLGLVLVMTVRIGVPEAVYSKIDTRLIWGEAGGTALALALAAAVNYFFDRPFPSSLVFWVSVLLTAVVVIFGFLDREGKAAAWLSAYDGQTVRACLALCPLVVVITGAAVACATRLSLVVSMVVCVLFFGLGVLSDVVFARLGAKTVGLGALERAAVAMWSALALGALIAVGALWSLPWRRARPAVIWTAAVAAAFVVVGAVVYALFGYLSPGRLAATVAYSLVPNFQVFWMGEALSADKVIPWGYVAGAFGYGALYTAALVLLGAWLFEGREIQ